MPLSVFDPKVSLHQAVNRLMEDRFIRSERGGPQMPVDVVETQEAILVTAVIPGTRKENLSISYEKELLTIKAEVPAQAPPENSRVLLKELSQGNVSRTFRLPYAINADQAAAEYQDGVLRLTLPKRESVRPHTIQVN